MDADRQGRDTGHVTEELAGRIFSASAGLVGVCLTVIGLFRLARFRSINSVADNLLAVVNLGFLLACFFSYLALRGPGSDRARRLERIADLLFLASLAMTVVVGALIAYELI